MNNQQPHKSNPPYLLGLLGLIPLLGVFVGIALILYGIIKYRSKWLVAIGIGCIAFTFLVYSSLLYYTKSSGILDKSSQYLTKKELYELTRDIEFYRLVYGHYPDSLSAVSYTHLDVYKRQSIPNASGCCSMWLITQ